MAQKESHHKEVVDDLTSQLSQVRKQHEELQVLSRDQVRCVAVPYKYGAVADAVSGTQHDHGT